ncbi:hypothetical protein MBGDF03_00141 [Thermoplasmatales archaeon SCGC AB-540-F20]|nr:hypothetical protein MBGDF03_00141 [Thermoplasmatales archaeon SCGC AB-540-F20]
MLKKITMRLMAGIILFILRANWFILSIIGFFILLCRYSEIKELKIFDFSQIPFIDFISIILIIVGIILFIRRRIKY